MSWFVHMILKINYNQNKIMGFREIDRILYGNIQKYFKEMWTFISKTVHIKK